MSSPNWRNVSTPAWKRSWARMRSEWLKTRGQSGDGGGSAKPHKSLSVLQTLEQSVSEHDELGEILKIVREKVETGEIDENDYKRIQDEISNQKQLIKERETNRVMPTGVIKASAMAFILEKEIARANRYDYSFSALAFSMVRIKPRVKVKAGVINNEILMESVLALFGRDIPRGGHPRSVGKKHHRGPPAANQP